VWHVGGSATPGRGAYGNYVDLVAAHGLDCVDAALVRPGEMAFPTTRARDVTPETRPAVLSTAPDSLAAYLTDIDALPDGSVAVTLGVAKRVVQKTPAAAPEPAPDAEGFVTRTDPVTGRDIRLYVGPADSAPPFPLPAGSGERR